MSVRNILLRAGTASTVVAVTNAEVMKDATAAAERFETRDSPQTPCPDVQPEPSEVPYPTSAPPATIAGSVLGSESKPYTETDAICAATAPPTVKPPAKACS